MGPLRRIFGSPLRSIHGVARCLFPDTDGNGAVDLAVLDYVSGDVALLRGLGQGGFLPAEFLGIPGEGINLRAGDLVEKPARLAP